MGLFSSLRRVKPQGAAEGAGGKASDIKSSPQAVPGTEGVTFEDFKAEAEARKLSTDWKAPRLELLFKIFDLNGNGWVDQEEFSSTVQQLTTLLQALDDAPAEKEHGVTADELRSLNHKELAAKVREPGFAERLALSTVDARVTGNALAGLLFAKPAHLEIQEPPALKAFTPPSGVAAIRAHKEKLAAVQGGAEAAARGVVTELQAALAAYRTEGIESYDKIHALPNVVKEASTIFSELYQATRKLVVDQPQFDEFKPLMKEVTALLPEEKPLQRESDPIKLRAQGVAVLKEHYAPLLEQLEVRAPRARRVCCDACADRRTHAPTGRAGAPEGQTPRVRGGARAAQGALPHRREGRVP